LEADVAAADRQRFETRPRITEGDQQGEDVVAGGVGIDDETGHPSRASSSARVGGPGVTPSCPALGDPAAHPPPPASRASVPSASATANAAQKASPAPVVSTGEAGNAGICSPRSRAPCSPSVTTIVASAPWTANASLSFGTR